MKTYQFDQGDAVRYGVSEAIFLWRLRWWLRENRIKGRNRRDGRTWSYDNAADLAQVFEFWSESQVRRIIASLVEQGAVMKASHGAKANDHTLWLALCDESALESAEGADGDAGDTGGGRAARRAKRLASRTPSNNQTSDDQTSDDLALRNRQAKSAVWPDGIVSRPDDSVSRPYGIVRSYKEHLEDSTSEDTVDKKQQQQDRRGAQDTAKAHAAAPPDSAAFPDSAAAGIHPPGLGKGTGFGGDPAPEEVPAPGGKTEEVTEEAERAEAVQAVLSALAEQGVEASADLVRSLIRDHGRRAVIDQARWLPKRGKGHRLRILRAALKDGYEDPDADPLARLAAPAKAPPGPASQGGRVTRIGQKLTRPQILAEIRGHGRAVVLREMAEHHERCRRGGSPDDVLSRQCELIEFLGRATDAEIAERLGDSVIVPEDDSPDLVIPSVLMPAQTTGGPGDPAEDNADE